MTLLMSDQPSQASSYHRVMREECGVVVVAVKVIIVNTK